MKFLQMFTFMLTIDVNIFFVYATGKTIQERLVSSQLSRLGTAVATSENAGKRQMM